MPDAPTLCRLSDQFDLSGDEGVDAALDYLDDTTSRDYRAYVVAYLLSDRREQEVWHHPDMVVRFNAALLALEHQRRTQTRIGLLAAQERAAIGPLVAEEQAEQVARKAKADQRRAEAHIARQRALQDAQVPSLTQRAYKELAARHQAEFVRIKKEIKAADAAGQQEAPAVEWRRPGPP